MRTDEARRVLGVSPQATTAEVRRRFLRLSLQHHPDTNGGSKDATSRFMRVRDAYRTLAEGPVRNPVHSYAGAAATSTASGHAGFDTWRQYHGAANAAHGPAPIKPITKNSYIVAGLLVLVFISTTSQLAYAFHKRTEQRERAAERDREINETLERVRKAARPRGHVPPS